MANVQFLRGAHSNLPTGVKIQDGAFYLTSDTNRLYVGKGTGTSAELVELNKSVTIVDYVSTSSPGYKSGSSILPTSGVDDGQFYLALNDNILCVYKNGSWKQINKNTDTKTSSVNFVSAGDGTVTLTHTDSAGATKTGTFKLDSGKNITISKPADTTNELKISAAAYSFSGEGNEDNSIATINLKNDHSTNSNKIDDSFTFIAGNDISLTQDKNNKKKFTIAANTIESGTAILTGEGKIAISLTDQAGKTVVSASTNPISYTVGGQSYIPGATLPVYTATEIDNKLKGLDAMKYCGTVGTGGSKTKLPTEGVSAGDTYLVVSNMTVENSLPEANQDVKKGDLLIATGTENNGVLTDIKWTYVPAGDDAEIDTTYTFTPDSTNHKIQLTDSNGGHPGSLQLLAGTQMALSSSGEGTSLATTINHGQITTTTSATDTSTSDAVSVTAITGITTDNGHITAIQPSTISLRTYTLNSSEAAIVAPTNTKDYKGGQAVFTTLLKTGLGGTVSTGTQKIMSDTLSITAGTGNAANASAIKIDLAWGEF